MNRLNLLFFALLISFIHNYYSEFNTIFLQSFLFLFFSELISVKLFSRFRRNQINQQNQTNQEDDDSSVSDLLEEDEDKTEESNKCEEKVEDTIETVEKTIEEKTIEKVEKTIEEQEKKEGSEETPEESDSETEDSSDEPVDITDGIDSVDVSQMEILRLLNNYESLGDSGLMELKKKMLELDKLVEFYKNDTKKAKKE
jgi:hypothetical protein